MAACRIALANLPFASSPAESVRLAVDAIRQAGLDAADLLCFPECYVPGYRVPGRTTESPDPAFLERAWSVIADAAALANVGVLLGTERLVDS